MVKACLRWYSETQAGMSRRCRQCLWPRPTHTHTHNALSDLTSPLQLSDMFAECSRLAEQVSRVRPTCLARPRVASRHTNRAPCRKIVRPGGHTISCPRSRPHDRAASSTGCAPGPRRPHPGALHPAIPFGGGWLRVGRAQARLSQGHIRQVVGELPASNRNW